MDNRVTKLADLIINYSLAIKKGEKLFITGGVAATPLMLEAYRAAIKAGALVQTNISLPGANEILLKTGSDEQIMFVPEASLATIKTIDAYLGIWADVNTRAMSNVDPEKIRKASQGGAEVERIFVEREAKNELRWCGTQYPTQANAQEGNMSLAEYEDFVYGAGMLDLPDPVAHWKKVNEDQERICKILDTKKKIRIVSTDTDISMSVAGRKWVNCSGEVNFPDGEIFTGPVEDTVEGHIRFSFPGIYAGREIEDIRLTFEKGKVVKAEASKGQELLEKLLDTDAGSRYVGEVAVGTNFGITKFTRNMLFDEKIGGTVHMAIGRSIPESLGKNESVIHWDMLCDMRKGGEIYADGEIIYKDSHFLIG